MSAESAGARRALAALSDPSPRLFPAFDAAGRAASELEPELLLLDLDIFGGLAVPAKRQHAETERRPRQVPPSPPALGPTARRRDRTRPLEPDVRDRAEGGGAAAATARTLARAPLARVPGREQPPAPVLPLRGPRPSAAADGGGGAAARAEPAAQLVPTLREAPVPLAPMPAPARREEAPGGETAALGRAGPAGEPGEAARVEATFALLAELADSLLRDTGPAPPARRADTGVERAADPDRQSAGALEAELLGPVSADDTGAAVPGAPAGGGAAPPPVAARGAPAGAPPGLPRPDGSGEPQLAFPAGADHEAADTPTLAALVNDELVEQARRHGLELT